MISRELLIKVNEIYKCFDLPSQTKGGDGEKGFWLVESL